MGVHNPRIVIHTRSYNVFSQDSFVEDVKHVCWSDVYEEVNPCTALEVFVKLFMPIVDNYAPVN